MNRFRPRPRALVLAGVLVAVLGAALAGLVVPASAATTAACSTPWGFLDKSGPPASTGSSSTSPARRRSGPGGSATSAR
jgi:hypothetical protein